MGKFYNTVDLKGKELAEAKVRVGTQEHRILNFFKTMYPSRFTAHQVEDRLGIVRSSIVRGLSNLRDKGLLIKTTEKVMERLGVVNHLWVYANAGKPEQMRLL